MFGSLRHRNFAMFWSAAVLSNTGSTMQQITVPFVVFSITNSTAWLGISAAVAFVPNVVVAPIGGALADRYRRRSVLLVCQAVSMASATGLWILWVTHNRSVGAILATVSVGSIAGGINISSWQAFVPSLVPKADLMNAVRLNSIQFNVARAAGPVCAGLVLAQLGAGAAFLGNAASFAPVVVALLAIPAGAATRPAGDASMVREFVEGLGYVRRHPTVVQCVLNSLVLATLAYAVIQLAPAVARDQLHLDKAGYGFLVSVYGAGSILTSLVVAARGDRLLRSRAALGGFAIALTGLFLLGWASSFWLGAVAFFLIGTAQTVSGITYMSAIQVQVADVFRGRVLAVYLMFIQLGFPLGALALGAIATTTGTRWVALGSAVALVAYVGVVLSRFGAMRNLDHEEVFGMAPPVVAAPAG